MVEYTKQFARMSDKELSLDERNILSVAFKNIVGTRRAAWRVLNSIQKKENNKGNSENVNKVKTYKSQIEKELTEICQEILDLLVGGFLLEDEGRLPPLHRRVRFWRQEESGCSKSALGLLRCW